MDVFVSEDSFGLHLSPKGIRQLRSPAGHESDGNGTFEDIWCRWHAIHDEHPHTKARDPNDQGSLGSGPGHWDSQPLGPEIPMTGRPLVIGIPMTSPVPDVDPGQHLELHPRAQHPSLRQPWRERCPHH